MNVPSIESLPAAQWIWCDADVDTHAQLACFRLSFDWSGGDSGQVFWYGFADTTYTLFCNGQPLGAGPTTGIHTKPRLTAWALGPCLRHGTNVLAIEVWFDGRHRCITDADPWKAGLLGWLITPAGVVPTGSAWKGRRAGTFTMVRDDKRTFAAKRIVIADYRDHSDDWTAPDFDDRAWPPAVAVAPQDDPDRAALRDSSIPALTCRPLRPAALIDAGVATGGGEVVTADDVAARVVAQEHRSLVRTVHTMLVLSTERQAPAFGLVEPQRLADLGWPDVRSRFQGPLTIPPIEGDFYIAWDMGLQTSGNLWLDVQADGELAIDVAYADHLHRGRVNPLLQGHAFADRLLLGAGRRRVHLPHDRGFRYLQLTFSRPAVLHDLRVDEHVYPHDDAPAFESSDATLNGVWQLAVATLHQCSLHSHVDNARRERQGWAGPDFYAQLHGFFGAFGDLRLSRKTLEDFLDFFDANGFIPDWAPAVWTAVKWIPGHDLWFPIACWDYLLYSDDRELAPRLHAACQAVLDFYMQHQCDGLVGRARENACRWAEWNMNAAQNLSTWENLLAIVAWRAMANLRQYLQLPGQQQALATADELAAAVNERLWHDGHRALAQGTRDDGSLVDFCAQLDNAFAVLHGILTGQRAAEALTFCGGPSGTWPTSRGDWQGCGQGEAVRYDPRKPVVIGTPFGSSMCAEVISRFVAPAEALQYVRYNFGAMVDEGEGTLWEMWPVHQSPDVSATCFSQGYGSHITATILRCFLGVEFLAPGGSRLSWRPPQCGLGWARGSVQTRHGRVELRYDAQGLHYRVPAGVTLVLQAPDPREIPGPAQRE